MNAADIFKAVEEFVKVKQPTAEDILSEKVKCKICGLPVMLQTPFVVVATNKRYKAYHSVCYKKRNRKRK